MSKIVSVDFSLFLSLFRLRLFQWLILLGSIVLTSSLFLGHTFITTGNIHDWFIPYRQVIAYQQGLSAHQDFYTPFGFVYLALNNASWNLINAASALFSYRDLICLTNTLFAFVLSTFWFIGSYALNRPLGNKLSLLWLAFLWILCFQVRDLSVMDHKEILWYGSYNAQLWSMLLLQTIVFAVSMRHRNNLASSATHLILLTLHSLCTWIALHYKINFGLASLLVWAGHIYIAFKDTSLKLVLLSIVLFLGLCLVVIISGYSYQGYFLDLFKASKARSSIHGTGIDELFWYFFLSLTLLSTFRYLSLSSSGRLFICVPEKNDALQLVFEGLFIDSLLSISFALAIIGDYQRPFYLVVCALAMVWLLLYASKETPFIKRALAFIPLCFFFSVNCISLGRVVSYKYFDQPNKRYYVGRLAAAEPSRQIRFVYPGERFHGVSGSIKNSLLHNEKDQIIKLSYHYLAGWDKNSLNWMEWMYLPYSQEDYLKTSNQIDHLFKSLSLNESDSVLYLEFASHLPFTQHTLISKGSFHWTHFGTTFSYDEKYKYYSLFDQADLVLIPIYQEDAGWQTALNLIFYEWNFNKGQPFKLFELTSHLLCFVRQDKAGKYGINKIDSLDGHQIGIINQAENLRKAMRF